MADLSQAMLADTDILSILDAPMLADETERLEAERRTEGVLQKLRDRFTQYTNALRGNAGAERQ